jgi:hypothetical protein
MKKLVLSSRFDSWKREVVFSITVWQLVQARPRMAWVLAAQKV